MNLNGVWRLGICTDEEYRKLKLEIKDLETLEKKGILVVNGTVPGNYELDLEKQHLIENPFFGENLLQERGREKGIICFMEKPLRFMRKIRKSICWSLKELILLQKFISMADSWQKPIICSCHRFF